MIIKSKELQFFFSPSCLFSHLTMKILSQLLSFATYTGLAARMSNDTVGNAANECLQNRHTHIVVSTEQMSRERKKNSKKFSTSPAEL